MVWNLKAWYVLGIFTYHIVAVYLALIFFLFFSFQCNVILFELIVYNMITVMKSLFLEVEISQYLIMVSDLKPVPNASVSYLPRVLMNLFG